jgi:dethiobiotin synthetase
VTPRGWFIAGTDTGVGKTRVACALLEALRADGRSAVGMKPVAAGCHDTAEGWRNDDALALLAYGSFVPDYEDANPYALPAPLSPHLAAAQAGVAIDPGRIAAAFERLARNVDRVVVEGAGGWLAPVSERHSMANIARLIGLPVILVVGLRLGCLNHAQLSARAIVADGCVLAGWIGNVLDPAMAALDGNLGSLRRLLPAPCLGVLPWAPQATPAHAASDLRLPDVASRA